MVLWLFIHTRTHTHTQFGNSLRFGLCGKSYFQAHNKPFWKWHIRLKPLLNRVNSLLCFKHSSCCSFSAILLISLFTLHFLLFFLLWTNDSLKHLFWGLMTALRWFSMCVFTLCEFIWVFVVLRCHMHHCAHYIDKSTTFRHDAFTLATERVIAMNASYPKLVVGVCPLGCSFCVHNFFMFS